MVETQFGFLDITWRIEHKEINKRKIRNSYGIGYANLNHIVEEYTLNYSVCRFSNKQMLPIICFYCVT